MANEKSDQPTDQQPEEGAASPRRGPLPMVLAVVAGLVVGVLTGTFVAGPLLATRMGGQAGNVAADGHGSDGKEQGQSKDGELGPVHTIDNLVLNPAGTSGMRFLMLTLAVRVKDAAAGEAMKTRDAEVRDALLRILSTKTVEQLTDVDARPALKEEIRTAVAGLFPEGTVGQVYLPQFVIQ